MTSHNIKGEFAFSCDGCSETITPSHQDDLRTAWIEALRAGWTSKKINWGRFEHYCPDCGAPERRRAVA
jgi:hypothetical protein